jgi:hypothetical protein
MKLPEINRHMVGIPAILLLIAGLGFASTIEWSGRRVESLSGERATAEQASVDPSRVPKNAYGFAGAADRLGENVKAVVEKGKELVGLQPGGDRSTERDWSAEEWRIAEKAVSDHRSKTAARDSVSGVVWAPPAEIAGDAGARR